MVSENALNFDGATNKGTLDTRSKIGMLAVYSVSIFFIDSWAGLAIFAALVIVAMIVSHVRVKELLTLCIPVYVICGLTIFFNVFQYHDGAVLPTWDGALRGCFFAVRILLLVFASLIVCLTVSPTKLTRSFCSLLSPLKALKVPVEDIAMVFSISLRFIPIVYDEFFRIRDSQWSRGAEFNEGSIVARLRSYCSIFIPLIASLFISAERLSKAMDVRAYGLLPNGRTDIHRSSMNGVSWIVLIGISLVMIGTAVLI